MITDMEKQMSNAKEQIDSSSLPTSYGGAGKIKDEKATEKVVENSSHKTPVIITFFAILFFMAGVYAIYDTFTKDTKQDIPGIWYDRVMPNSFYILYKKNEKIYLNYSHVKEIECVIDTIKGKEYIFRDGKGRKFTYKTGTPVYVGKGFEEAFDVKGNTYKSNIILLPQGNRLIVYTNDYEKEFYDELCTAKK